MSKAITDAIYGQLTASQIAGTVYAALSGRIYHLEAKENETLPLLVFGAISNMPEVNFDGSTTETCMVEFTLYGQGYEAGAAALQAIDDKLLTCLEGQILSPTGYDRLTVRCRERGVPSKVEDAIAITSVYRCVGTRY